MLTLTKEQQKAVDTMASTTSGGALNGSDPGTGKTAMALAVALARGAKTVLVIAPVNTADGWEAHLELMGVTLPFKRIENSKTGQTAKDDFSWNVPGVYFVGHEYFVRLGWRKEPIMVAVKGTKQKQARIHPKTKKPMFRSIKTRFWSIEPDMVIFDEVHRGQSAKSMTHKTLMQLSSPNIFKLAQSGTWMGNSFDGAYAVTKWVWPHLAEDNIFDFRKKWAQLEYDHFAPRNQKVIGELNPGAYVKTLPCYVRLELDLQKPEEEDVYVHIGKQQRKAYDDLVKNYITWINDNPLVVEFPQTLRTRLLQGAFGMFSVNDEGGVYFDNECQSTKIDALYKVLDDDFEGEKALVLTHWSQPADVIAYRLEKKYGKGSVALWKGGMTDKQRAAVKAEFISGDARFMVGVTAAMGTGTDGLQRVTRNIAFVTRSDSRIDNEQGIGRAWRTGQTQRVRVRHILALNTEDLGVASKQIEDAIQMNKSIRRTA